MNQNGTLFLVSTPIGNLEDITIRALNILKTVDIIACEDTRHTLKLLNHFEIKKPLESYHEHNKREKGAELITKLINGKNIALVSDAGTPGISDPGEDLVRLAHESNVKVSMAPGASAAIMGLVLSGLTTSRFVFEGFLSVNRKSRRERIEILKKEERTIILYEAPHKLIYTLEDLYKALGNRKITLARELTKKFEEIIKIDLESAIEKYKKESPKGEFVIILEGKKPSDLDSPKPQVQDIIEHVKNYILQGIDKKDAIKKVAKEQGLSKRDVYNQFAIHTDKV